MRQTTKFTQEITMTNLEIFNDIEKLAREVQGRLGYQPLDIRRKISSIANLARGGRANIERDEVESIHDKSEEKL